MISTIQSSYANIKKALDSILGDLFKVITIIKEKIEDQLQKIHF